MGCALLVTMTVVPEETLDDLIIGGIQILQAKKGYRFSLDPVLLNGFVSQVKNARVIDLGTGNGIIPLLMSVRNEAKSITGIELQQSMVERAWRTVQLNKLEEIIQVVQADIRELPEELSAGGFDVVTTNPPYRKVGTGRVAQDDERAFARHELSGGVEDFLRAAAFLLNPSGQFYVVYLAERLAELLSGMQGFQIEPKRLRMVHSREGDSARMVLVEGLKNGKMGLTVEPPLIVYAGKGRAYTDEVLAMYGMTEKVISNQ